MNKTLLLQDIEQKIKKLKSRNDRLEKENVELRQSVFEYLQKMESQKKEVMEAKAAVAAGSIGQKTKLDAKILKKDLDRYILMIDKCIASVQVSL